MIFYCKNFGNLTGGTKSSSIISKYVTSGGFCKYTDEEYCTSTTVVGVIGLISALFKKEVFYGFDHYLIFPILFRKKTIFYFHSSLTKRNALNGINEIILYYVYRLIIKKCSLVVATSKYSETYIRELRDDVKFVYPIYNYSLDFVPQQKVTVLTTESKALMIGNIDKRKYGFLSKHIDQVNIHIDIYGSPVDPCTVKALSANPKVNVLGFIDVIPFDQYDFLLFASTSDNVPAVIPEAIAAGLPVVSIEVGGVGELITSSRVGAILCPKSFLEFLYDPKSFFMEFDNSGYFFADLRLQRETAINSFQTFERTLINE